MNLLPGGNTAQRWFRIILWFVPSAIVLASAIGLMWLAGRVHWLDAQHYWIALFVVLLSIWGVGVFEGVLCGAPIAKEREREIKELLLDALVFVLIQLLFIPTFLGVAGMLAFYAATLFGS